MGVACGREMRSADDSFGKGGRGSEAREKRGAHGGFDREPPARAEVGVGRCRGARKTNVQLWPVAVYCSAAVAVGPEPEGRVRAAAHGDERFAEIMKSGAVVCSAVHRIGTRACAQSAVFRRNNEERYCRLLGRRARLYKALRTAGRAPP